MLHAFQTPTPTLIGTSIVATPANAFRQFGYTVRSDYSSNEVAKKYFYWPLTILDHAYNTLTDLGRSRKFHHSDKLYYNRLMSTFHNYWTYVFHGIRDNDYSILDDFDNIQREVFVIIERSAAAMTNYARKLFSDEPRAKLYALLMTVFAECSMASMVCQVLRIRTDPQHDAISRTLSCWITAMSGRTVPDDYESTLLQNTMLASTKAFAKYIGVRLPYEF